MSVNTSKPESIKTTMVSGAAQMIAARWFVRLLGVVNIIILARLLDPDDFGVIAMATVLFAALQVIFSLSIDAALIRNTSTDDEDYNTAWTIGILQSLLVATILFLSSASIGKYFNDERVVDVIQLICLSVIIRAFSNIGIVAFRKELQFRKEVFFSILSKLATIVSTLVLAYFFRTYWALVWGMVLGSGLSVILSYLMHPFRPRVTLSRFEALWSYSYWMVILNVGMFLSQQGDRYIIGGAVSTHEYGLYTTSGELAELPTTELIFPISKTLFPGFAKIKHDKIRLKNAFLNVIGFLAAFSIPAGLGVAVISDELVYLLLGPKWLEMLPFLQILALYGVIRTVYVTPRNLLVVLGREKYIAGLAWANALLFLGFSYLAVNSFGLLAVALVKVFLAIPFAIISFSFVSKELFLSRAEIIGVIYRPVLSGGGMVAALSFLPSMVSYGIFFSLAVKILIGLITYSILLLLLWAIANRPTGFESFVFELLKPIWKRVAD